MRVALICACGCQSRSGGHKDADLRQCYCSLPASVRSPTVSIGPTARDTDRLMPEAAAAELNLNWDAGVLVSTNYCNQRYMYASCGVSSVVQNEPVPVSHHSEDQRLNLLIKFNNNSRYDQAQWNAQNSWSVLIVVTKLAMVFLVEFQSNDDVLHIG